MLKHIALYMKKSILLGVNFKNRENKTKIIFSISDTDKKLLEKIINCETQKNSALKQYYMSIKLYFGRE